ncbi:related to MFS sugar transporter [Phialocephala subalpina]|uniref:Related to MFS sugar transporter n=1 Tax=Phialocephala subalpina TaxID=576137 RepID=A0A1L7WXI8_9HELO|nr:related to MFS sugar transporter [Phialocephala subalpina]
MSKMARPCSTSILSLRVQQRRVWRPGLLSLESFVEHFPTIDTVHTIGSTKSENARIQGTVVALYTVGCMFGALSCFSLGDKLGRLRTIVLGCILEIISSILLCSSFSLAQLIVGRLVLGLGFGAITATVPVWQAESSPAEHRGALVVLEGVFASAGLAISQWIDLGLFFAKSSVSWRFPLAFPIVFAGVILAFLPFLPDSPRWLVKHGRIEEARAVMATLKDTSENLPMVENDIAKMQHSLEEMGKGRFRGLLSNKEDRLLNRTLLAMFSAFSQQINGIGVIGFYTATIFEEFVGVSQIVARVLSGSIYIFQLLCCFVAFGTIDRIGRRKLMMFGATGMGICSAIVAGTVSQAETNEACSIVAAICVFLFALFFGIGALGINYLYGTGVAPLAYRVPIYALTTMTLWSFNFLVVEVTSVAFSNIGYKYFIVFACTNLFLLLPGKSNPPLDTE